MRILMIKTVLCTALAALVLPFCLTDVHADTLKEKWYMSRGKDNLKIKNYKASIEAFEKLVEINPNNREAMRLLGLSYELQGLTDKAIEQYDLYLQRFPDDADIAFKQARYMEDSRFAYRKNDAVRYYRMGLKAKPQNQENRLRLARLLAREKATINEAADEYKILIKNKPRDAGLREEYARLLGARLETSDQAIRQYHILIDQHPGNSVAHRELAAAYAWQGDQDRAIYHAGRALRYDPKDKTAARIKDELMQGREPELKTSLAYLSQSGNDRHYAYSGFLLAAGGKTDITPFATGEAEIGREKYRHDATDVEGTFYKLSLQGRFDPRRRVDAEWKYHDFADAKNDAEFLVQYSAQNGDWLISPGIRREFKYDSLLALAGDTDIVTNRKIGSARSNTAFCKFTFQGERFQSSVMPYAGYVSADSTDNNSLIGADADARLPFFDNGTSVFSAVYKFQTYHYAKDNSGFVDARGAPSAGGYYSPELFVNNALLLEVSYELQPDNRLRMSAGPSVQYSRLHSGENRWNTGADLDLAYERKISSSFYLMAQGSYNQVANVYHRYDFSALVAYKF